MMHHVMKYGRHGMLVGCACVFQPERHHSIVEIAYASPESSLLRVFWRHSNLIISTEAIHEGKHGVSYYRIYQQVHVWQRGFVFWAGPVEISEVYTAPYLHILLLYWHNVGKPTWVLDGINETRGQQLLYLLYYLLFYFNVEHSSKLSH